MNKTATIIGSTGMVGSLLLRVLLSGNAYDRVIIFVRNKVKASHPKLIQHVVDFDSPETYQDLIEEGDMYCCLGTTIKKAKTQEAFEKVDLTYPIEFAKAGVAKGIKQFLIVSSLGADPQSGNFYLRTKGRCEEALRVQAFKSISIFRPSLLLGRRKEFRLGEKLLTIFMGIISVFMIGPLRKYRAIRAKKVAYAMYAIARRGTVGFHAYESDEIADIYSQERLRK